jgi:aspartyl-tRNA(Asn)/glutamyl-tRNA(Gln) amidotransferase subunit A
MSRDDDRDLAAMKETLAAAAQRLHGIVSRTSGEQLAAEVLRLNDAVRAGAAGRFDFRSQPGEFGALLLASADPTNGEVPA